MPIEPEKLKELFEQSFAGAEVKVTDTAGDMDHFDVVITWEGFRGKSLIEQHRMVNEVVKGKNIHAVSAKTIIPK